MLVLNEDKAVVRAFRLGLNVYLYIMLYFCHCEDIMEFTVWSEGTHFVCSHTMYCMYFNTFLKILYFIQLNLQLQCWQLSVFNFRCFLFFPKSRSKQERSGLFSAHVHKDSPLRHSVKGPFNLCQYLIKHSVPLSWTQLAQLCASGCISLYLQSTAQYLVVE